MFYFANRSLLVKETTGLRDVGFSMSYTHAEKFFRFPLLPVSIMVPDFIIRDRGIKICAHARRRRVITEYINFSLNYQTFAPDSIRMNVFDVGAYSDFTGFISKRNIFTNIMAVLLSHLCALLRFYQLRFEVAESVLVKFRFWRAMMP